MQAFTYAAPSDAAAALAAGQKDGAKYIAGGTDLMQLAKDEVETPRALVDIAGVLTRSIAVAPGGTLRLGALAAMSDVAAHPEVRAGWPGISEALLLSASPQIRNMGTVGGNLLQRTRCGYFRDTGSACNKRAANSGCPAVLGDNRSLGVIGTSDHCIATHPSDLPVALLSLDAAIELLNPNGGRRIVPLGEFYRLPGSTPQIETNLLPGELIAAILVPPSATARRSRYVKVRDRASFEFAVVSAAVALDVQDGLVREVRVALGGVAPKPWRLPQVEAALHGRPATDETFRTAAALASEGARPAAHNAFKRHADGPHGAPCAAAGRSLGTARHDHRPAHRPPRRPSEGDGRGALRRRVPAAGLGAGGAGAEHDRRRLHRRLRPAGRASHARRAGDHHAGHHPAPRQDRHGPVGGAGRCRSRCCRTRSVALPGPARSRWWSASTLDQAIEAGVSAVVVRTYWRRERAHHDGWRRC